MKIKESQNQNRDSRVISHPQIQDKIIRVLLADDHTVVREGFKLLLEKEGDIEIVGEASTGEESVLLANSLKPDVILLDVAMNGLNGLHAAHKILGQNTKIKIIILSMYDNDEFIQQAIEIGVQGYLLKEYASEEIIKAIREVSLNGYAYYGHSVMKKILEIQRELLTNPKREQLTTREREVLLLVAEGKTSQDIGKVLNIGIKTVEKHRQSIMDKLKIHDVAGLTRYAIRKGIIPV